VAFTIAGALVVLVATIVDVSIAASSAAKGVHLVGAILALFAAVFGAIWGSRSIFNPDKVEPKFYSYNIGLRKA